MVNYHPLLHRIIPPDHRLISAEGGREGKPIACTLVNEMGTRACAAWLERGAGGTTPERTILCQRPIYLLCM